MTNVQVLETLLEKACSLPPAEIPEFLGSLERVRCTALARLSAPAPFPRLADERVDITEAARRLGVSEDYLYRHHRKFDFTQREGRRLLFSARGIERHISQGK